MNATTVVKESLTTQTAEPVPKFSIGHKFTPRGKSQREHTIVDIHFTRNLSGELVKFRYVTIHNLCGRVIFDSDVVEATVAMGTPGYKTT